MLIPQVVLPERPAYPSPLSPATPLPRLLHALWNDRLQEVTPTRTGSPPSSVVAIGRAMNMMPIDHTRRVWQLNVKPVLHLAFTAVPGFGKSGIIEHGGGHDRGCGD